MESPLPGRFDNRRKAVGLPGFGGFALYGAPGVHPAKTSSLRTTRRFPRPWSVEELEAMTRPTKSKIEAIKPDQQDFDAVEKQYGPLPPNASQAALAERYRLAQAAKVRQLEQGRFQRQNEKSEV